jgi:hypothetical protein
MVYRISGSHSNKYECYHLLGYKACAPYVNRRFGRTCHHLQGRKSDEQQTSLDSILPDDGGDMFLQNIGSHMDYTTLYPRRFQHYYAVVTKFSSLLRPICTDIWQHTFVSSYSAIEVFWHLNNWFPCCQQSCFPFFLKFMFKSVNAVPFSETTRAT